VRFVPACLDGALPEPDADEAVKRVREAYLVPMGLLARQGRGYVVPKQLERNELVRLLLPLLDHHPSPATVHEHLAQPMYGLVPDQVRLLLLLLLLQGQIDVQKDGGSYRSGYELMPDPLRLERGHGHGHGPRSTVHGHGSGPEGCLPVCRAAQRGRTLNRGVVRPRGSAPRSPRRPCTRSRRP